MSNLKKKSIRDLPKYEDYLIKSLQNKQEAIAYLQVALDEFQKDGDSKALLLALQHVAKAQGGISELSKKTNLNRETLYRTLSSKGNPKLETFGKVLNGLGLHLVIQAN